MSLGSGRHRPTRSKIRQAALLVAEGVPKSVVMKKIGYSKLTSERCPKVLTGNPMFVEESSRLREALLRSEPKIFDKVAATMVRGLRAKETKFFSDGGIVKDLKKVVNFSERRQSAELLAKLFGELQPREEGGSTVNISQLSILVSRAREERGLPPNE